MAVHSERACIGRMRGTSRVRIPATGSSTAFTKSCVHRLVRNQADTFDSAVTSKHRLRPVRQFVLRSIAYQRLHIVAAPQQRSDGPMNPVPPVTKTRCLSSTTGPRLRLGNASASSIRNNCVNRREGARALKMRRLPALPSTTTLNHSTSEYSRCLRKNAAVKGHRGSTFNFSARAYSSAALVIRSAKPRFRIGNGTSV